MNEWETSFQDPQNRKAMFRSITTTSDIFRTLEMIYPHKQGWIYIKAWGPWHFLI